MDYKTWVIERGKCLLCRHHIILNDPGQDKPGTIMRCTKHPQRGSKHGMYAIDARTERCGVEAKDWEPYEDQ